MAIKLQVQDQLGGRSAIPNASPVQRAEGTFGNVGLQAVNLPTENVGGNVSAILSAGQSAAHAANQWAIGLENVSNKLEGMAKAEDDSIAERTLRELAAKRGEILLKNQDRVSKGEITYMQLADENLKEYNQLHEDTIANLAVNYGTTRDNLANRLYTETANQYQSDAAFAIKKTTEDKIQGFENKISSAVELVRQGPEGLKKAEDIIKNEIYTSPMMNVVGMNKVAAMVKKAYDTNENSFTVNAIKANPQKYIEDLDNGLLGDLYKFRTPDEITNYRNEALHQIQVQQSAFESALNKRSEEEKIKVEGAWSAKGMLPSETEILSNEYLTPKHKVDLLDKFRIIRGDSDTERKNLREVNVQFSQTNSLAGIDNEKVDQFIKSSQPKLYENAAQDPAQALQLITYLKEHGATDIPKQYFAWAISTPKVDASFQDQMSWANTTLIASEKVPELADNKQFSATIDVATRMKNYNESYVDAKNSIANMTDSKTREAFNNNPALKDSDYFKNGADHLAESLKREGWFKPGYSVEELDTKAIGELRELFISESKFGGTDKEIYDRAVGKLDYGVYTDSEGNSTVMRHPPKIQPKYKEFFDQDLAKLKVDNQVNNVALEKAVSGGANSYFLLNKDTHAPVFDKDNKPVSISINEGDYQSRYRQKQIESVKPEKSKMVSLINKAIDSKERLIGMNDIILGIVNAESSFDPNAKNVTNSVDPVSGAPVRKLNASGLFQMIPSTASKYGINEHSTAQEQVAAGIQFLNDLSRQYNGNTEAMLKHYRGYYTLIAEPGSPEYIAGASLGKSAGEVAYRKWHDKVLGYRSNTFLG